MLLSVALILTATLIRVDQVGYPANAPKVAAVDARAGATRFTLHRVSDGTEVFGGELSDPVSDADSGDTIRAADFSSVTTPGRYELHAGSARSAAFDIGEQPYAGVLALALKSFYDQRCGTAVADGPYAHPACHLNGQFHKSSGRNGASAARGGWHDAGDYGRYVVSSGITTATLLWANEMFGTPLLDEARWSLEWMLSMQDADGGSWHKQTSEAFPGYVMPQDDRSTQYVIGKSSCATGDLGAVAAIAARVYRPSDPAFADRSLAAAQRAWKWLAAHPDLTFRNPRGVTTGEYGDPDCSDERLWAAAELWRTTGDPAAHDYFLAHAGQATAAAEKDEPPDWKHVGALAAWTYALAPNGNRQAAEAIRATALATADRLVERASRNAYRTPMIPRDYLWGSNGAAANYGVQLLMANRMRADRRYADAAADIVHYLLGRNPFSMSYVTGTGTSSVRHPHHRPSIADGIDAPWPGLLAGGPDRLRRDSRVRRLPANTPPARTYIDDQESYSTNEVAINWNAPLVFILAGSGGAKSWSSSSASSGSPSP